jgi:hypothetical protein
MPYLEKVLYGYWFCILFFGGAGWRCQYTSLEKEHLILIALIFMPAVHILDYLGGYSWRILQFYGKSVVFVLVWCSIGMLFSNRWSEQTKRKEYMQIY